jgi:hypothetical protein
VPYIITVNQPGYLPESDTLACATIDEARCHALDVYDERRGTDEDDAAAGIGPDDPIRGAWLDCADAIETLPEHGGVVGPLPDGYVIDVQFFTWDEFMNLNDACVREAIDAYNAGG